MSKIGRRAIPLTNLTVDIKDNQVCYKGKLGSGCYTIPDELKVTSDGTFLTLSPVANTTRAKIAWGTHRALLANALKGASVGFEKQLKIVGLGYKAIVSGNKVQFALGYSHKIDFPLPDGVTVEVDKTGQLLTLRGSDKVLLGRVGSTIRALREPEPYKGTGIQYSNERIIRKAGKTKA